MSDEEFSSFSNYRRLNKRLKFFFMIDQIYTQMKAMQMLTKSQEITADNLANLNTPGYKGSKVFYQMMNEEMGGKSVAMSTPQTQIDLTQGVLEATGNSFDLAVDGEGFFTVQQEGQTLLTRNGRFYLDDAGTLVDQQGSMVMGEGGPINLSELMSQEQSSTELNLQVQANGTLTINGETKAKLQITNPQSAGDLQRKGSGYFTLEGPTKDTSESTTRIVQGFFEKGNVEPLNEMVDMMQTMQLFESQQKAMRTTDEILTKVTGQLGRF